MQYLGGKSRIAKQIASVMLDNSSSRADYLEPFVGGGSVFVEMAPHFERAYASDICPDLIALWQAVLDGWIPPVYLSEEEYHSLKSEPTSALKGFAKYACSFGGKPWGGFARQAGTDSFAGFGSRSLVRKVAKLTSRSISFDCLDFAQWEDLDQTIIYCDPPYKNTTGYGMTFDHTRFWRVMDEWSEVTKVFVSELEAPAHWEPIWELKRHRKVDATSGLVVDCLFTRK